MQQGETGYQALAALDSATCGAWDWSTEETLQFLMKHNMIVDPIPSARALLTSATVSSHMQLGSLLGSPTLGKVFRLHRELKDMLVFPMSVQVRALVERCLQPRTRDRPPNASEAQEFLTGTLYDAAPPSINPHGHSHVSSSLLHSNLFAVGEAGESCDGEDSVEELSNREADNSLSTVHTSEAIRSQKDTATSYYNLGVAFMSGGDTNMAIQSYKRSQSLDPTHALTYNNLGIGEPVLLSSSLLT
jgi:hypothetical protein